MANVTSPTDQRPFTAIVIRHDRILSPADVPRLVGKGAKTPVAEFRAGEWSVWRWEYLHKKNLYPANRASPERSREGGWAHDLYIAQRSILGSSYVVVASPYVRLLRQLDDDLRRALSDAPALQYLNVNMERVFESFQRGKTTLTATKVTLEILDELENLELVSLTGSNPLNSKLHSQISKVAAPYAIRVEVSDGPEKARVSIDRVGNLWWYQTSEQKTRLIFRALDDLISMDSTSVGRRLPLDLKYKRDQAAPGEDAEVGDDGA